MTTSQQRLPALLAFPPLLYLLAFALGWVLDRLMPMAVLPPATARIAGGALTAASVALMLWSRLTLSRAGTTAVPGRTAAALTLAGPYQLTRNPMCLAMAGLYLGLSLLLNAVAPLVLFLPVFALMDRRVIPWEERALEAKFGAPYTAYCCRVRRWL